MRLSLLLETHYMRKALGYINVTQGIPSHFLVSNLLRKELDLEHNDLLRNMGGRIKVLRSILACQRTDGLAALLRYSVYA
jgi:hypothetical protein